jgi:diguanylate cyclase (GGDEF)-like protein
VGSHVTRRIAAAALGAGLAAAAGADGWWLALPVALWLSSMEPTPREGAIWAGLVLAVAAAAGRPAVSVALAGAPLSLLALTVMRVRLERERDAMRRSALRDPLTGVCNRRALDDRLRHEIARHARARERFTVLLLDLDGFKPVNDRLGHAAGDELLREVAHALVGAVRAQDTVARLGGDEFCVVAPQTAEAGAAQLAERVLDALAGVTTGVSGLSASIGTAHFPEDARDPAGLLAAADAAVLEAKRRRYAGRRDRDRTRHAA